MNIEKLTNEEMLSLFQDLLEFIPEVDVLLVLKDWVKERGLEGEL